MVGLMLRRSSALLAMNSDSRNLIPASISKAQSFFEEKSFSKD